MPDLTTQSCSHGMAFDDSTAVVNKAFGEEFEITCDQQYFIPISNTAYIVGMFIGGFWSGPLSDRFGRRTISFLARPCYVIAGLLTTVIHNIWLFVILRVITASFIFMSYFTSLILVSEWTTPYQRNSTSFFRRIVVSLSGRCLLIFWFWIMPSWRSAYAMVFIQALPALAGYWVWYESPRWLLSRGRITKAHELIMKVMKWNKKEFTDEDTVIMKEEIVKIAVTTQIRKANSDQESVGEHASFMTNISFLLRKKKFRTRFLLLLVCWSVEALLWYGLSYNSVRVGSNPLIIALFGGVMFIPSSLIQYLCYRFFDRKWPMVVLFALSGIALGVSFTLRLFAFYGTPVTIISTIGLLFSTPIFTLLYIRTPEVFPTTVRSTTLGLLGAAARLGMTLASFVERLDQPPLTSLIFLIAAILATIAAAFLPSGDGQMEEWNIADI